MGSGYGGKPRPALVVQGDDHCGSPRIVFASINSPTIDSPSIRIMVEPSRENGLRSSSEVAVDILMTIPVRKIGRYVGTMERSIVDRVDRQLLTLLGFAR